MHASMVVDSESLISFLPSTLTHLCLPYSSLSPLIVFPSYLISLLVTNRIPLKKDNQQERLKNSIYIPKHFNTWNSTCHPSHYFPASLLYLPTCTYYRQVSTKSWMIFQNLSCTFASTPTHTNQIIVITEQKDLIDHLASYLRT